ncbi:MAG: hypothetical protein ACXVJF_02320 [Acidimicrobiia bacterium]
MSGRRSVARPIELRDREPISPEAGEVMVRVALGGLAVDGYPTSLQCEVLHEVARHVARLDVDVTAVAPMDADEAATLVVDEPTRRRLVQLLVALELLEEPSRELARHVRAYARTLSVDEPMVNAARRIANGQIALMYADIQRNSYYTEETAAALLHGHLWRLLRSKIAYSNVAASRAIERKWAALRDMPAGSLGRAVAEFYRVHHFPLPGAKRGIGEVGAHHDFVHVLADYPPTPEGEIDVFAFIAAAMNDPKGFVQLVMTLGLFQNATITHVAGKRVVIACSNTLEQPGAAVRFGDALERGGRCRVDALGIDHFAIADQPLDRLRDEFAIAPREDTTQPGALDPT